jgi:sortase (surface protein transpeptidase)
MRARLRPHGHARTQPTYVQRGSAQLSRKLFQDINNVESYDLAAHFMQANKIDSLPVQTTPQASTDMFRKPDSSRVLMRQQFVRPEPQQSPKKPKLHIIIAYRHRVLTALAVAILVVGGGMSFAGYRANKLAALQAAKASIATPRDATTTGANSAAASTAPVTDDTLQSYQVAPDLARYIRIPKLNVMARVLQVGITKDGALATPTNVFDAAWYKNSAKPGQPGATLIDGHVSSWTTNGVFYGIKTLAAGDMIELEKGDGTKLQYTVVQTTAYPADAVDMNALQQPITAGKSGLNLITCGGKYDSSKGEFTQRISVYATQNN